MPSIEVAATIARALLSKIFQGVGNISGERSMKMVLVVETLVQPLGRRFMISSQRLAKHFG